MANPLAEPRTRASEEQEPPESDPEFTNRNILQSPWNLWRYVKDADAFFRQRLSNSLYYTLLLRLFRRNIESEVSKKRSRRGTAIKRAYRYSKADARRIADSLEALDLNQLWSTLDESSSLDTKSLNQRLDSILSKNPPTILKGVPEALEKMPVGSDSDSDSTVIDDVPSGAESPETEWKSPKEQDDETIEERSDDAAQIEDRFFKLDEMEAFANEELGSEDDIDYFDSLGSESDDSVAAADMRFSDFFRDPEEGDGEVEEFKPLTCKRGLEDLDEYDKEMELMLQKLEDEGGNPEDDEDERYRDEIDDFNDPEDDPEDGAVDGGLEYYDTIEGGDDLPEEDEQSSRIAQVESELVAPKHWSLMGESSAKNRPRNSLLDLDLELPQPSSIIHVNNEQRDDNAIPSLKDELPLELIITQRIKSGIFDNVERKYFLEDQMQATELLKKNKAAQPSEEIDFSKSEMGLGEVYAQKYREQFMAIDKLDGHKKDLNEQFAKLIYKLDALSNSSFVPKRVSESEKSSAAPIISVETPVNVVIAETSKPQADPVPAKVSRSTKKRKFKNKMRGLVKAGKLTPQQAEDMKEKMRERNKKRASDLRTKKATGLTTTEAIRHESKSSRKINTTQLLCNIDR